MNTIMKVAMTAFPDQSDMVSMQREPKDRLRTLLTGWDFTRETDKLRTKMCSVVRKMGDPISKPLNKHEVLHCTLLRLCCPDMTEEKMEQSAREAQRSIVDHFMEPVARKKFRKNLTIERVNVGSTEVIDLNYLLIKIKELEMVEKYRPMGDLSLTEDTVRIMRAGEDPWTGGDEGDDSDDWGEVNAGFVFNGCFR